MNRNITINDLADNVLDLQTGSNNSVTFEADADNSGTGDFVMNDVTDTIRTQGDDVNIFGASVTAGNIDTTGTDGSNGGTISIAATNGNIAIGTLISSGRAATVGNSGNDAGNIRLFTGNTAGTNDTITLNGNIMANGGDADAANTGGNAGSIHCWAQIASLSTVCVPTLG